jgi:hypothetical protein
MMTLSTKCNSLSVLVSQVLALQEKSAFVLGEPRPAGSPVEAVVSGVLREIVNEVVEEKNPELPSRDPAKLECAAERQTLVQKCLNAMKECYSRFPHHYKSVFRAAQYYSCSSQSRDLFKVGVGVDRTVFRAFTRSK